MVWQFSAMFSGVLRSLPAHFSIICAAHAFMTVVIESL